MDYLPSVAPGKSMNGEEEEVRLQNGRTEMSSVSAVLPAQAPFLPRLPHSPLALEQDSLGGGEEGCGLS